MEVDKRVSLSQGCLRRQAEARGRAASRSARISTTRQPAKDRPAQILYSDSYTPDTKGATPQNRSATPDRASRQQTAHASARLEHAYSVTMQGYGHSQQPTAASTGALGRTRGGGGDCGGVGALHARHSTAFSSAARGQRRLAQGGVAGRNLARADNRRSAQPLDKYLKAARL
jgi:hypothetical protein